MFLVKIQRKDKHPWLQEDKLKIPVRVKTKVVVGSVDAYLKSYEGLAGKLTSRISD